MASEKNPGSTRAQRFRRLTWAMGNPFHEGLDSTLLFVAIGATVVAVVCGGALLVAGFAAFCWAVYAWLVCTSLKEYDELGAAAAQEALLQVRARNDERDRRELEKNRRRMAARGAVPAAGAMAMSEDDWSPYRDESTTRDEPTWDGPMANVDGTPFAPGMSVDVNGNAFGVTNHSFSTNEFATDSFGSNSWNSGPSVTRDD